MNWSRKKKWKLSKCGLVLHRQYSFNMTALAARIQIDLGWWLQENDYSQYLTLCDLLDLFVGLRLPLSLHMSSPWVMVCKASMLKGWHILFRTRSVNIHVLLNYLIIYTCNCWYGITPRGTAWNSRADKICLPTPLDNTVCWWKSPLSNAALCLFSWQICVSSRTVKPCQVCRNSVKVLWGVHKLPQSKLRKHRKQWWM